MENSKILSGHRAVVTGASSGIGREYARQLADLGADVVIAARRLDRLEVLAEELRALHKTIDVQCVQVDLSAVDAAKTLFEKSTANGKKITILVNNAGTARYGSFMDFPLEDHSVTMRLNTVAPTEATYLFVRHMLAHGKKSYITQVASIAAFQPVGYFSVYSGTKVFMRYFSESLSFELKNTNVSCLCLCPGGTYTEFFEHSGQKITASGHATMMTAQKVVHLGIRAMMRERTVLVPGILNKLACFFPRLVPRSFGLFIAFKTMNRAVEKIPAIR
jgi:short-subunit dehydrogenase